MERQRLIPIAVVILLLAGSLTMASAAKFYPDDPLHVEPPPISVPEADERELNDFYDFFSNLFFNLGELKTEVGHPIPAQAVNTLGEPMDSTWWVRRHYYDRMSIPELVAGVGIDHPPAGTKWTITSAKGEGVTPGFFIKDEEGTTYILKFDPIENPGMATGADVISGKILHALGYHVPENYIVYFDADQLVLKEGLEFRDRLGKLRPMEREDVVELLNKTPKDARGRFRAVASLLLDGKPVGPFRFWGTRSDDPNDIVPHEHRRDLRGYRVFCAWIQHDDSRSANTLDMLVEEGGRRFIKHYLIDFGSTLGSGTFTPNSPRQGYTYLFDRNEAMKQFFTLGIWVPKWARKEYEKQIPAVGLFEAEIFDPVTWVPEYPNSAFINANPDDEFWAAKQVMAFTPEEIRAMVETAEYDDPRAIEYLTKILIERQQKIGRAFFSAVLPLDKFAVESGKLVFADLEVEHDFTGSRQYEVRWSRFDNKDEEKLPIEGAEGFGIPPMEDGDYVAADISAERPNQTVTVFLRKHAGEVSVVGIERTW